MNYTQEDIKRISDFQKYARFICDQFDVEIELDSTKAETDGKIIKLPNIMGLNEKELDMMYAVLLHEAGHIRYSSFTEEDFLKLKTQYHAFLANCIEDARIENLLIKDFGGATDIFENLYCNYLVDKKMLRRIFQITEKRMSVFFGLGLYVHGKLLKCKSAPLSKKVSPKSYKIIKKFIVDNDIDNLLKNTILKNWDDVIKLTNIIYDLFSKDNVDKSKVFNFAADIAFKQKTNDKLKAMKEEVVKLEQKLLEKQIAYEKKEKEIDDWELNNQNELEDLLGDLRKNQEKQAKNQVKKDIISSFEAIKKSIEKIEGNINRTKNNIDSLTNEMNELKKCIDTNTNLKGRKLTDKQKEAFEKKITNKADQIKKSNVKMDDFKNEKDSNEKEFKKISSNLPVEKIEDLNTVSDKLTEEFEKITTKQSDLMNVKNKLINEANEIASKIQSETNAMLDKCLSKLYEMDELASNHGLNLDVLPEYEETPEWPEADIQQKQFDKKASEENKAIVRNGGRLAAGKIGPNLRDIGIFIDTTQEKVKSIDLTNVFKNQTNNSRFSSFSGNEHSEKTMLLDSVNEMTFYGSTAKHTVLTTEYDKIVMKNTSNEKKVVGDLLIEGSLFIKNLKNVFMKNFKLTKKDFYLGGREEGSLDVRNIWKLASKTGDDYFEINQQKNINKMASCILIDVSGSQDKDETEHGKKLRMVALALSEALKSVHVKHEILGYHAPISDEMKAEDASFVYNRKMNRLETVVYKTFNQKDNFGIGNINLELSDNSDGESIRIAVNRLNKERAKTKSLFILSDSKPFLSNSDVNILDEDLKLALREATNKKIKIFSIGFTPNGKLFYGNMHCYPQNYNEVVDFFNKIKF